MYNKVFHHNLSFQYIVGVIGPFLLVKENEDSLTHGSVHIKSVTPESNQGYVVHTEQTIDLSGDAHTNGNTKVTSQPYRWISTS